MLPYAAARFCYFAATFDIACCFIFRFSLFSLLVFIIIHYTLALSPAISLYLMLIISIFSLPTLCVADLRCFLLFAMLPLTLLYCHACAIRLPLPRHACCRH